MRISARISISVDTTSHQLKRSSVTFLLFLIIGAIALAVTPAAQAQTNFVYVNNQGATNTISAFSVDPAGLLTPVAGSPFSTGGTGATALCSGINRIVVSPTGNHLFVSNGGDQSISAFQINPTTGTLTAAPGSPFASGLTQDACHGISLAATPDGAFLMASSNGTIKTFSVASNGVLTSGASTANCCSPMVGMKISPNGQFLATANEASASVFTINLDGSLTAVPGSPFPKTGTGLISGLEFSCSSTRLYAAEGGATSSLTDAWTVGVNGDLSAIPGSPFTAAGTDSNVVFLTPDSTVLYQSNQGDNSINGYPVNADGTLGTVVNFAGAGSTHAPVGMASDNSGLFLYAADDAFGLAVFNIFPDGTVTLVGDTAITGAGQVQGVAAYPPRSCIQTDFTITQTATPNPVTAGNNLTYTITIKNNGPNPASVAVNDVLPLSTSFLSCTATGGGVCDKGNGKNRTITFASLATGASGTVTIVASTLSTLLNQDTISNTSTVSNSSAFDPNPADNAATTAVTVSAPPSATNFLVAGSAGTYFGSTTLSATLRRTLNGAPIVGRTVNFTVLGVSVGSAVTNASGIATLPTSLVLPGGPINAGTYTGQIGVSFAGDAQYAASTGSGTLTVNKATLTVTAQNASRLYGDPNPAFTYVISGFLNNETVAVVSGAASCTSSANNGTPVGTSPITCSLGTLAATNYNFVFVSAIMTINPAPLLLAGNSVSRLYGDVNPPITGTIIGLKNTDKADATFSTTALTTSPVGSYPITATLTPVGGFSASNYSISFSGTVTVTPAPLTAAATSVSRLYGDPNPAFTGTISGLKNGDVITASFSAAADPTSPVGTYPITATFTDPGNKLGNYTVVPSGALTITPAPLTVVASDASRLYGDPNPAFTGTVTGLKNGDNITATFSSTAVVGSPVGTYPIVATLVDPNGKAGNYTFTPNSGTLTVNPAPLAVTAADASRLYGDPNPAFTGAITGIKNADNITASYASAATPASAVGTFSIVPALVDPTGKLGNYSVLSTNGTLTVTPAPLSVTAANVTRPYGDPNPALTGTITGIKNGDAITATYASAAIATSPVGAFSIVPTLVDPTAKLGNYTVTSVNGTLTVAPALLTVTGANASRLYGDPNPAFTGTLTGIKNGDNITATFASAAVATSPVGTFAIVPTLADPTAKLGNYTVVSNNGTLTIGPAPLTAAAADATRLYGDANPAFTGTLTGLKNGDNITATFTSAATPASNVGTFAIVPALADPTLKLGNYSVTLTNGTLSVTPAPLSVTAGNASRPYGDPNPAFTGTIIGLKNGDNITATVAGADAASAVGTYPLVPSLVDPAGKLGNYSATITNGTLTVTPAALTVSAGNATRAYGDPNPAFTGTITGTKNNDNITATFSSAATLTSPVGSFAIIPALVDPTAKLGNYAVTSNNGTLTVAPASLTVTGANASRLYGDPNPAFTGTITGIKNADNITATFSTAAVVTSPVGNFAIVPTLVDPTNKLTNYTVTSNNGTLAINPATLTVTGTNASRVYGDPNPAFTGTLTGLKNGDNITATFSSAATAATSVGTAAIVPTLVDPTAKLGNYAVTSNNGTLTITPAALTVTAGNATRVYGDPNPAFIGTITGLKNGDNITATVSGAGADPTSPVGTYVLVPALADPAGKLGNYTVTTNNGTLTVTPAALSVAAASATRAYGDPNPIFGGTITGIKNNDNITATYSTTAVLASPVGTFPIVPTLVDSTLKLSNYTVTSTNGTLTIGPAALTIAGTNATRLYGDANPAFTGTITGLKNADNITATFASTATPASNVGTFAIVPTPVDPTGKLSNYTLTLQNGTLTVTAAPLTVAGANATRVYGDPNPAFTGAITGLKNGDNITATFSSAATAATSVGTAAIVPALVDPTNKLGNYAVTSNNGTLTITPAPLTVTAGNATRVYGDPNPAFTGTITGLKNGDVITATVSGAGADPTSPVGTYALVPALQDPTGKLGNYAVTSNNGILTVTAAPLSVVTANASRAYGDPNPSFTATITGLKNADNITASFTTPAVPASPVGTFPIVVSLNDPTLKLSNYTVTSSNGTLTINPAALSVAGGNATRLYGDPNPAFTGTITGIKNADNITASFSSAAVLTSPVGTFPIVPAVADPTAKLGNYTVTSSNGTLTVAAAPLTVTGTNASRLYGDPNPAFTGTLTGLKNADNITATFSSAATAASNAGSYPIVGTLADPAGKLGNYAVTSNNGTLTVNPAALSVTVADASRVYGDPNPAFSGTITGLKNADNITATFSSAGLGSPVGTFAIVASLVDPAGKLGNYTVTSSNGTLTVTPAALAVTAASANRPYGAANPALTGTISGIKNADAITATYSSAANTASAVGTYPILPALVDPTAKLGNYTVTSTNGVLTVTQAKPSVVLSAQGALPSSQLVAQVLNTGPALPTGTVQFFDGSASLGAPVPLAPVNGVAQASLQVALAPGAHSVTASYAGDATYTSSVSTGTAVNVPNSQFAFTATGGNTTATISAGQNAVYNFSLAPQGFTGTVSLACSGAPTGTNCNINPTSVTFAGASASAPITVTISGTQNARLKPFGFRTSFFVFAGVLAGLAGLRRKRKELVLLVLAGLLAVGMVACGGSSNSSSPGPVVRPPTNATITITGTSGAQNATINLSLTITH